MSKKAHNIDHILFSSACVVLIVWLATRWLMIDVNMCVLDNRVGIELASGMVTLYVEEARNASSIDAKVARIQPRPNLCYGYDCGPGLVGLPLWPVWVGFGTSVAVLRLRCRRDTSRVRCQSCQYSLVGLGEPRRCPECGREVGAAAEIV